MALINPQTPFFDSVQMALRAPCADGKKLLTDSAFQKDHRLVVEGVATHAGLIINRRCYRPYRVKDAARSMYDPAPVPIVIGHYPVDREAADDCRGVGTIQLAQYIDTRRGRPEDAVITKWDASPQINSLGHLRYWGYVDDEDAIPRVLDGRLNRQSVGFYTNEMRDSITGIDLYSTEVEEWPEHVLEQRSEVDGQMAYLVPGQLAYYHLAFTDEPADPWAGVDAFRSAPREIQETCGTFQLYAQDSEDGLMYDMASADSVRHFRKPLWAMSFDFAQRRDAELDRIRREKLSAVSNTGDSHKQEPGSLPAQELPSQDDQDACKEGAAADGAPSADTHAAGQTETVPAAPQATDSASSEGDREVPNIDEEATMDKILELIRGLGKGSDTVVTDIIAALGLTDEQIRSLEPVAKILTADSEAAAQAQAQAIETVKAEAKAEADRLSGELKAATDKLTQHEAARKVELVDRLFATQVDLGGFKKAEIDGEDKIKALKEELAKQPTDSLEFSLRSLERLRDKQAIKDTVSVIPKKTGKDGENDNDAKLPRFMKISG